MSTNKTNLRITAIIVICLFLVNPLFACTTFVINDSGQLVYGRNFDWDLGWGFITVNNRGLAKQATVTSPYEPARWISKYGSITFNQIGIDAPMGGMNEKGLVIAQMGLFDTHYPDIEGKNVISNLEWIQYQLDNSATLNEVIENCSNVNIDPVQVVPLHYFICDSTGNIGVIEFLDGKLVVIKGEDLSIPVCSNMPYRESLITTTDYKPFGGEKEIPEKWNNIPDIIAIANSMIKEYKNTDNPVDYSFKILDAVGSATRTQWSIVFDIKNKKINYKTLNNKSVRTISLDDYNFKCSNETGIMDIQESKEKIVGPENFESLTVDFYYNYKLELNKIFKENIEGFPDFPDKYIMSEVEYAINRKCN